MSRLIRSVGAPAALSSAATAVGPAFEPKSAPSFGVTNPPLRTAVSCSAPNLKLHPPGGEGTGPGVGPAAIAPPRPHNTQIVAAAAAKRLTDGRTQTSLDARGAVEHKRSV